MHRHPQALVLALLAGITTAAMGCTSRSAELEVQPQPLPEAQPMRFYSGMAAPQRLVVRDTATWEKLWPQIVGNHRPVPPVPVIDFISDVVIVAAMGTEPTGGYSIEVDDVRVVGEDASISVVEKSPDSTCVVTDASTAPVAIVVVPTFAGHATFIEHATKEVCPAS
jgi:hypothetical protein